MSSRTSEQIINQVAEIQPNTPKDFKLRANLPRYFRYAAVGLLGVTIIAVVVGFYRSRNTTPFKLKSEHTQLSTDVVAEVTGYERLETDNGVSKYYVKADYAKTFSDNHQELENAYFEIFDDAGNPADKLSAQKVLYVPEENKNFTAYMNGNVNIESRDGLKVKTNNITYSKSAETADADELVEFARENIRGKSVGATVKMGEKRLDLLKDVEIEAFESPELVKSGIRYAKINAASATYDQIANKIDLNNNVAIAIDSKSKSTGNVVKTDVTAGRASLFLSSDKTEQAKTSDVMSGAQLKQFEMFDNVHINSVEAGMSPTTIDAGYALFDKASDRYELKDSVHIVTTSGGKATDIRSANAIYDQAALKIALTGGAEISQDTNYLRGDAVNADLFADKKLKYAVVTGNGFVRQTTTERTTSVSAPELNVTFNDNRQLSAATTIGQSTAQLVPNQTTEYSLVTMTAPRAIHLLFKGEGLLEKMQTDGRTTIQLDVPNRDADAANKRVTADTVKTTFNASGKDIQRAEAVGNAELFVEPLRATPENYKTTINAPRFDCEFFPTGNNAKTCVGGKKTKTVRVPTVAKADRGTQTLVADQLTANFSAQSKDVEQFEASGNTKFTELDRNAIAGQMSFSKSDETLRMRGGEPTAWDSRARAKAREIDWDTKNRKTYLRGGVSTTYYSRKAMADTAPFAASDKPVFMTSDNAEFDHGSEIAVYTGNARGWQENNYVRGDRVTIQQSEGKFTAEGNVQSAVYNVKQKLKGKESTVPVFATSRTMTYERDKRIIQYRDNVDIRQGTDRLTSGFAEVYLNENNELSKTIAENSVVITQPGRRATGNWVQYTAGDEKAIIRGNPASITDTEQGSSQAAEFTFMMRESRFVTEGKTKQNGSGRIRSTYKINPDK